MTAVTALALAVLMVTATACDRRQAAASAASTLPVPPSKHSLNAGKSTKKRIPPVGTVDGAAIPLAWVQTRLTQMAARLSRTEAVTAALLAAAADVICLREFAVLDLKPRPDEAPQVAVDRLLAETWPEQADCRADGGDLKLAYLNNPGRWRHPTALTLWEAQITCCRDCGDAELDACQQRSATAARQLHADLRAALPPPLALTRTTLEGSPARRSHLPIFERILAKAQSTPRPELLRYTAFARQAAFRKMAYRRTNPAVERATLPLAIGGLTAPVRTSVGWSIALVIGHEDAVHGNLRDPKTRRGLRALVCRQQAVEQRTAYRSRMLSHAQLKWDRQVVGRVFGAQVSAALPRRRRRRQN